VSWSLPTGAGPGLIESEVDARIASLAPGLAPVQSVAGRTGAVVVGKSDVGLGSVPNVVAVDAAGAAAAAPVQSVNASTGAVTVAAASHVHAATDITSGRIDLARMPAGNPSGVSLRGTGTGTDPAYSAIPVRVPFVASAPATWVAMPSSLTEFLGGVLYRQSIGLAGFTRFRLAGLILTAGLSGSFLRLRYSTNGGGAWTDCGTSAGDLSLTATGAIFGAWENLVAGAKADVILSVFGDDGDGIVAPVLGSLVAEVV